MTMQTTNGTANGTSGGAIIERVIALGDLEALKPYERAQYYARLCESMGLNALTQPFMYVRLNGKLQLYARKDATDQLRKIHRVSLRIVARELDADGVYTVTARASMPDGREDESTGCVAIGGAKGENLANAKMKAETKAKRRVTLSICGLGWLDESEVSDVRGARPVTVTQDGEILDAPPAPSSGPDLTAQLHASVDWGRWASGHVLAINAAASRGAVNEVSAVVADEVARLDPPEDARAVVREAIKARKAALS